MAELSIEPVPTDEEAAAIAAAVEAMWPRPTILLQEHTGPRRSVAWRFSGRWWAVPLPARRDRPWY